METTDPEAAIGSGSPRPLDSRTDRHPDGFFFGAMAAHLAIALTARVAAWPEVTTPAYLASRGMLLYRDIKFVHTPGLMALLALVFGLFGVSAAVVRAFAILGPLVAHALLLRQTRPFSMPVRLLASGFFVVLLLDWAGSAVWPTVLMMPLSLPLASALSRGRFKTAGLLIGVAILLKQTAAYVLVACIVRLLWKRRLDRVPPLVLWAGLPYAAAALLFALLGSLSAFVEWTLIVPFWLKGVIDVAPAPAYLLVLAAAVLPLAIEAVIERPGEYETSAGWLLAVALGFILMVYPRFGLAHAAASIPCLTIGAARLLGRSGRWRTLSYVLIATIVLTRGAGVIAGTRWDSKIEFWNADPAFNALVDRLRALPPDTPLSSDLFDNVYPRSGLLPPGRLYYAPWLYYLAPIDSVGERTRQASRQPGVVFARYRSTAERSEGIGPYAISRSR